MQTFGIEPAFQFNLKIGQCVRLIAKNTNKLFSSMDPRIKQVLYKDTYIDGIVSGYLESKQSVIISTIVENEASADLLGPYSMMSITLRIQDIIDMHLKLVELIPKENSDE